MRKKHSALLLNTLKDAHNVSLSNGRKDLFEKKQGEGGENPLFFNTEQTKWGLDVWGLGLGICKHYAFICFK